MEAIKKITQKISDERRALADKITALPEYVALAEAKAAEVTARRRLAELKQETVSIENKRSAARERLRGAVLAGEKELAHTDHLAELTARQEAVSLLIEQLQADALPRQAAAIQTARGLFSEAVRERVLRPWQAGHAATLTAALWDIRRAVDAIYACTSGLAVEHDLSFPGGLPVLIPISIPSLRTGLDRARGANHD